MVRLDKIIYMITCFKSFSNKLEQSQYSIPNKDESLDSRTLLVMKRMGVISENEHDISEKIKDAIPFGREEFLMLNIKKHYKNICSENSPRCSLCAMNMQCDYYNKKNEWKESY